ncbi:syndecan-4 isoform X1 [Neomonachus schauinslandi]|uniref:Syndecan-4 n=2 Tax=Monachinae TaxID=3410119 RepID=A0A2U3XV56_LEPWE|nr:syndecan-4 [Leptonychotes weddellii]XP_021544610.1 syndecan-4 isoform X1 [Neomonachus schauinslandi]
MALARLLALLLLLVGAPAAAAESIRETEVIDPQDLEGRYFSGALPDDEDVGGPGQEPDDFELSGSGDLDDSEDPQIFPEVIHPLVPLDNFIPERAGPGSWVPTEPKELEENEVIPKRISSFEGDEDVSNKVSMSSTAQGSSIFERTEVLAALIVGSGVGILFAVFLVLLLVCRMKKKDEGTYDLGKKPIYKKAPTNEFYA